MTAAGSPGQNLRSLGFLFLAPAAAALILAVAIGFSQTATALGNSGRHGAARAAKVAARLTTSHVTRKSTATAAVARRLAVTQPPAAASLGPLTTIVQTLNNCGPASVAEMLAYWHVYRTQAQVQAVLRADTSPWGMAPYGVPFYAQSVGLRGMVGAGGSERLIKVLVANGFPVIVSQQVSAGDPIRHYRPIEAYSDRTQTFVSADPYLGAGHVISYAEFQTIWSVSDNRFVLIYPASRQARLNAVLTSAGWNVQRAYTHDLSWEQARMRHGSAAAGNTWISHNGYAALAWDEAQIGRFTAARAYLAVARQRGTSPVILGWVQQEINQLERSKTV